MSAVSVSITELFNRITIKFLLTHTKTHILIIICLISRKSIFKTLGRRRSFAYFLAVNMLKCVLEFI
jgi:hypothetical protein